MAVVAIEVPVMRKVHIVYVALGLVILSGVSFALWAQNRINLVGQSLVGSWVAEPIATGVSVPHCLTLKADGTGMDASGVGNFDCRWKTHSTSGDNLRVRLTHTGESYWKDEPRDLGIELIDADTIRIDGRVYKRLKQ